MTNASAETRCALSHGDPQGENLVRGGLWEVSERRIARSAHGDAEVQLQAARLLSLVGREE